MAYITWEFYGSLYDDLTEDEFDLLEPQAQMRINIVTFNKASLLVNAYDPDTATDFEKRMYAQLKNTVADTIHALHLQKVSGMGSGLASVSNDGYTESYKVSTATEAQAQINSVIRIGLAGTGLAGVY